MKPAKRLMIEFSDGRRLFTHMKNLPLLVEFAKTFKVKIAVVKVSTDELAEMKDIVAGFCDPNFKSMEATYEVLQNLYPKGSKSSKSRTQILEDAKKVKQQIREDFLKSQKLTFKQIKSSFEQMSLTDACLSTHFSKVRKELENEGYSVEKLGIGSYKIQKA